MPTGAEEVDEEDRYGAVIRNVRDITVLPTIWILARDILFPALWLKFCSAPRSGKSWFEILLRFFFFPSLLLLLLLSVVSQDAPAGKDGKYVPPNRRSEPTGVPPQSSSTPISIGLEKVTPPSSPLSSSPSSPKLNRRESDPKLNPLVRIAFLFTLVDSEMSRSWQRACACGRRW